jgi:hypothetical protein
MFANLRVLAFRMQELQEMRSRPQSILLIDDLAGDVHAWRVGVLKIMSTFADNQGTENAESLRARLDQILERLEGRVEESLDKAESGTITNEQGANMYRLLGAYRGLSEALVQYTQTSALIDWPRLCEARF